MPDDVNGYARSPFRLNGGILYDRRANPILVDTVKLAVCFDKAGNLIAHCLLIGMHAASLYFALCLN